MTKPTWVYAWAETSIDEGNIATVLNRLDADGYDIFHMKQEGHSFDIVAKLRTEPAHNSPEQKEYFLRLAGEALLAPGTEGERAYNAVTNMVRYLRILKT